MRKSVFAILVAAALTVASAQTAPQVANVGILFDYTGALSEFGPGMENGARLAADQLNAAAEEVFGGPLIRLVVEDAETSASAGVDRARKLVEVDSAVAIVGALSSAVTVAVAESVTIPGQVVLISPASTSPLLSILEDDDYVFRSVSSDATQGIVGGQLARGEIFSDNKYDTAAIMHLNNPYGQGLAEAFKAAFEARGGKVVAMVAHPDEPQPTYQAELQALLADEPGVVIAASYPGQATVYMAEARDVFDFTNWQLTDGTQSVEIVDVLGANVVEGLYGTAPGADPEWGGSQLFRDFYEELYGDLPNLPFIDTTYDAVSVIGLALAQAYVDGVEPNSTNLRDRLRMVAAGGGETVGVGDFATALRALQDGGKVDFTGAAGEVDFDELGDVMTPVEVWQYQDGKIVPVAIRSADEIPAQ